MKTPRIRLALAEFIRTEPGHIDEATAANDELCELEARVAYLEAALQDIEGSGTGCCQECGGEDAVLMQKIATDALHHK